MRWDTRKGSINGSAHAEYRRLIHITKEEACFLPFPWGLDRQIIFIKRPFFGPITLTGHKSQRYLRHICPVAGTE